MESIMEVMIDETLHLGLNIEENFKRSFSEDHREKIPPSI